MDCNDIERAAQDHISQQHESYISQQFEEFVRENLAVESSAAQATLGEAMMLQLAIAELRGELAIDTCENQPRLVTMAVDGRGWPGVAGGQAGRIDEGGDRQSRGGNPMTRDTLHPWMRCIPRPILLLMSLAFLPVHVAYGAAEGLGNWWYEFRRIAEIDEEPSK